MEYINADDIIAFCLYLMNKMRRKLIKIRSCAILRDLTGLTDFLLSKAWFQNSLAHSSAKAIKHKDIRTRRMAYLTQFSIPGLLNPMINKMADGASAILLLICSHKLWVKLTYDWSTALLVLMLALMSIPF